jgi:pilus assembly protein CpaB
MKRTPLIASVALILGGFVVMYLYQEQFRLERSGGPPVDVVMAAQDIPFGEPVRAEWLATKALPQDYIEDRHILANRIRDLIGLPLAQSVRAGETIMRTDLSPLSDQQRTLSAEVPQGSRAITILATQTSAFNGLLRPGDHVDLVLTIGDPLRAEGWHNALLLENVAVLAVGRQLHEEETDEGRRGYRLGQTTSVTLEVTFAQGALITQAQQDGRIQLTLRNGNDMSERGTRFELVTADFDVPERRERFLFRGPRRPPMVIDPPAGTAATGAVAPATPSP